MRKYLSTPKNRYFILAVSLIILLALVLRFYDYPQRYAMGADQAGFAIQAKYSVENFKLPMLGPFSSGAPFQTGGEWYWLVMLGYLLPFHYLSPWILLTISNIIFIVLIIYFSKELIDEKFALIVGLFAALSAAQLTQSLNLTNQSPQAIFSLLAFWFAYKLIKTSKPIYALLTGLMIGVAAAIHLQGGALVGIIIMTVLVLRSRDIKVYINFFLGLLIPWIPVLIKDTQNNFYNTTNMFKYYLMNENPIPYEALGRRWLTFAFDFIPNSWSLVIGGNFYLTYLIITLSVLIFAYLLFKRKLKKEWIVVYGVLLLSFVLLRYTRTPIFESYIVFIHPFIYLLTAFVVYTLYKFNKYLGFGLLILIVFFSFNKGVSEIKATTHAKVQYSETVNRLIQEYPNTKFRIYDNDYKTPSATHPIAFYLYSRDLLSNDGQKIGFSMDSSFDQDGRYKKILIQNKMGTGIYDLSNLSENELEEQKWIIVSPDRMYRVTQNWYK